MNNVWTREIDQILSVGIFLGDSGIRNWALTATQALRAIELLAALSVPIPGVAVYDMEESRIVESEDQWPIDPYSDDPRSTYVGLSAGFAQRFILNHQVQAPMKAYFVLLMNGELSGPSSEPRPEFSGIVWSPEIDAIMSIGVNLHEILGGVLGWALTRSQALAVVDKLRLLTVPISGIDTYERHDDWFDQTYDHFYIERANGESSQDWAVRSAELSKSYIVSYELGNYVSPKRPGVKSDIYFVIYPDLPPHWLSE